jgi:hypothetical protein
MPRKKSVPEPTSPPPEPTPPPESSLTIHGSFGGAQIEIAVRGLEKRPLVRLLDQILTNLGEPPEEDR